MDSDQEGQAASVRLQNLKEMTELVLHEGVSGDLIEMGVWRGGACILMRAVLAAYGDANRTVYVAVPFAVYLRQTQSCNETWRKQSSFRSFLLCEKCASW